MAFSVRLSSHVSLTYAILRMPDSASCGCACGPPLALGYSVARLSFMILAAFRAASATDSSPVKAGLSASYALSSHTAVVFEYGLITPYSTISTNTFTLNLLLDAIHFCAVPSYAEIATPSSACLSWPSREPRYSTNLHASSGYFVLCAIA